MFAEQDGGVLNEHGVGMVVERWELDDIETSSGNGRFIGPVLTGGAGCVDGRATEVGKLASRDARAYGTGES